MNLKFLSSFILFMLILSIHSKAQSYTLHLKLFIEGYYSGNSTMRPVLFNQCGGGNVNCPGSYTSSDVDDITVELRDPLSTAIVISSQCRLKTNGLADCIFNGFSPSGNVYYIAIKARSALETWSIAPVNLLTLPGSFFDFSLVANIYGGNVTQRWWNDLGNAQNPDGIYKIYSGDIAEAINNTFGIQDGLIESADYLRMCDEVFWGSGGYNDADLTGNGGVDIVDRIIEAENVNNIVHSMHP